MPRIWTKLKEFNSRLQESANRHGIHWFWVYSGMIITIVTIISGLFFAITWTWSKFYPPVYADFKEYQIEYINGTEYSVIEVSNDLDKTLQYIGGNVTIKCKSAKGIIHSKPYKLLGGKEFLGKDSVELFFSPDPTINSIIMGSKSNCSDANIVMRFYKRTQKNLAILNKIEIFDFILNEKEEIINVNKEIIINFTNSNETHILIKKNLCAYCDIDIKITASNIKTINEKEQHKYTLANQIFHVPIVTEAPSTVADDFVITAIWRANEFRPCTNLNGEECAIIFCNEMIKRGLFVFSCKDFASNIGYFPECSPNCRTVSYTCGDKLCHKCEC